MASIDYPLAADEGLDDLPRTFRREREAREREAREREAREREALGREEPSMSAQSFPHDEFGATFSASHDYTAATTYSVEPVPAAVKRFDVPFTTLSLFFLKAVVAAIPALILLGAILWVAGDILQAYFPWLIKMQIFIHFPE
ncbi:hypothetical protein [Filomicrobium sp.]|uniref:hypothetical protein n=1 Tax=Filomicrobium sp. TaxID=2024831 RepID=UPI002583B61C|nr:hypothetical protein [Filomicrobium sp.]MCV0369874.1 hypothetical protein [Filomicrobium sp.]